MDDFDWERATFRPAGEARPVAPPFKCDGCGATAARVARRYTGTDPDGVEIAAEFCPECVREHEAGREPAGGNEAMRRMAAGELYEALMATRQALEEAVAATGKDRWAAPLWHNALALAKLVLDKADGRAL